MRIAGIIAEFNPFHNGHEYIIRETKTRICPDFVVAIMSGNYMQRGGPAMWDKWIRARSALSGGVDLVLELPVCYATSGAPEFAYGGIRILSALNCVTHLAFGSECGDVRALSSLASYGLEETPVFSSRLRELLSSGLSYPAAYSQALEREEDLKHPLSELLKGPNDILGAEYLKQALLMGKSFTPVVIKRKPVSSDVISASSIRTLLYEGNDYEDIRDFIPEKSYEDLKYEPFLDTVAQERYFLLALYNLAFADTDDLNKIFSMNEGLENSFIREIRKADSIHDLIMRIKSKRHTYAKLGRIIVQSLIGLTKENFYSIKDGELEYARVLAFNEKGRQLLSILRNKSEIPVVTNIKSSIDDIGEGNPLLKMDLRAGDIYSAIMGDTLYAGSDFVKRPHYSSHS